MEQFTKEILTVSKFPSWVTAPRSEQKTFTYVPPHRLGNDLKVLKDTFNQFIKVVEESLEGKKTRDITTGDFYYPHQYMDEYDSSIKINNEFVINVIVETPLTNKQIEDNKKQYYQQRKQQKETRKKAQEETLKRLLKTLSVSDKKRLVKKLQEE